MSAENWSQVKEILNDVLELEPEQRQAYLSSLDLSDEIKDEISSLLAFESEAELLMDASAAEIGKDFFDSTDDLTDQKIGNYRIIREIGHGGMGAVFMARRDDGKFEQTVALKLLKREMNTSALRRHFEQEREILASLDHPNIARLLDAGTTDDQIPYIAMEYVDGVPINEYCIMNDIVLNDRLELFKSVCGAVEFAHRNLVVHRDLKPSNILVTPDGVPKLLDFGISKMLSKSYDASDEATITRMGVMTPSYASPEQLKRSSVTTLSDVYSLGVILYELMSGHRPYGENSSDLREIYYAVLEKEPTRPSNMLETKGRELAAMIEAPTVIKADVKGGENSSATRSDTVKLTAQSRYKISPKSLKGDLDNIILKALRKEPERRYPSVAAFSEDIGRYLNGLTVSARPNTFGYRASKFVARNRIQVASGALILCALGGGVGATLWQARIAQIERVKAEQRFNDVRTLANSFLFEFSPMMEKIPGTTEAQVLLVKRALEYLDSLSNEAGDDNELKKELAKAYEKVGNIQGNPYSTNIGDIAGAVQSYEKSRAIREALLQQSPEDKELISELAIIYGLMGDVYLNGLDEYDKAVEKYDQAYALSEKVVAADPTNIDARARLAGIIKSKGLIPFYNGDNKTAIEFYKRSHLIYQDLVKEKPDNLYYEQEYAFMYVNIGEAQGWDGNFEESGKNIQKGLEHLYEIEKKFPTDIKLKRTLMLANIKYGESFEDRKLPQEAVIVYSKAIAIAETLFANDQKNALAKRDVAMGYKKKAQALSSAGRGTESLETLNRSMAIFEELRATDPNNSEAVYDVTNLKFTIGETLIEQNEHQKAILYLENSRDGFASVLALNPNNMFAARMSAFSYDRLARCYEVLYKKDKNTKTLAESLLNFKKGLAGLEKMDAEGNLGDLDKQYLPELRERIANLEKSS